jgi:reactive intermediate/imine deaminase
MSDVRRAVVTSEAPEPAGSYSQAIVHDGLVWVAGQTPRRPDGTRLEDAPFREQARQALANVDAIARAGGSSLARALHVTVFLTDPEQRFTFDEVWSEFVSAPLPARAIVQSALPGFAVEVTAVCAVIGSTSMD